jgi:hypothetical protein
MIPAMISSVRTEPMLSCAGSATPSVAMTSVVMTKGIRNLLCADGQHGWQPLGKDGQKVSGVDV